MTRLEKFRKLMAEQELDGFLVTQPDNRRYLSGFTGSNGVLIITTESQALATDSRYYSQVKQECPTWELIEVGYDFTGNLLETLRERELGGRRVGFEAAHITAALLQAWERALKGRLILVDTQNFVETLRTIKEPEEITKIKQAVDLADQAYEYIAAWLKPGLTEIQVAWELETFMRTRGASALSFDSVVASGPNAAKPHARATDRVIQAGEPITMDFGCVVNGYCSDITRTICLGEPADDQYLKVWHTVLEAQEAAEAGAKAGLTGEAIDKIARDIIKEAGFEENFGHGLGHGVGLAVHESPRFSFTYPDEIPSDVVMTVEPGIYIPGWGGVRIEDMVVVRDSGVEVLTQATKAAILT